MIPAFVITVLLAVLLPSGSRYIAANMFILYFVFNRIQAFYVLFRTKNLESVCEEWLRNRGIKVDYIEQKTFNKGPLMFRTSDLQSVWRACIRRPDGEITYWFVFGGYYTGIFRKRLMVIQEQETLYSGPYA